MTSSTPNRNAGRRAATSRRTVLTAVGLAVAVLTGGAVLPAASAAPVRATAPSFHLRTTTAPARTPAPVSAVVRGVARPDLVTSDAPAPTPAASGPSLTLSQKTVENYWYFAAGVTLGGSGYAPFQRAVVTDTAPDGRVLTFHPVYADADGTFSTLIKYDQIFGKLGQHTVTVIADDGQATSVALTVTQYAGHTVTITVDPPSMTRARFVDKPVTFRISGMGPLERIDLSLISPGGTGFQLGADEALRADSQGRFTYSIQAITGLVETGTWEVSLLSLDQTKNGYATFTVSDGGHRPQANRAVTVGYPRLTQARLGSTGQTFTGARFVPFELVDMVLRDPQGHDAFLGRVRANGSGVHVDSVSGTNPPAGVYTLTLRSVRTGDYGTVRFVTTDAKGKVPAAPTISVTGPITRLDAMDPSRGIRVWAKGLVAGAAVGLSVIDDSTNTALTMDERSLSVLLVRADSTVAFQVNPAAVPRAGTYTVRLDTRSADGLLTLWSTVVVKP